jgi:hypothetical protein
MLGWMFLFKSVNTGILCALNVSPTIEIWKNKYDIKCTSLCIYRLNQEVHLLDEFEHGSYVC